MMLLVKALLIEIFLRLKLKMNQVKRKNLVFCIFADLLLVL